LREKGAYGEIREAKDTSGDVVKLYEAYVKDYQEDDGGIFLRKALQEAGNIEASAVFKRYTSEQRIFPRCAFRIQG
jgi:hypothetical protein